MSAHRHHRRHLDIPPLLAPMLWVGVLAFFVVGDTLTTAMVLSAGYTELNPLSAALIADGGLVAFALAKVGVTAIGAGVYVLWPKPYDLLLSGSWAAFGLFATVSNVLLVL